MAKNVERDAVLGRLSDVLKRAGIEDAGDLIALLERNLPKRLFAVQALDHVEAHRRSSNHRPELEASAICGCFYCLEVFPPGAIREWIDGGTTALCARCGIDSVIGSASGHPITREFLERMRGHWF